MDLSDQRGIDRKLPQIIEEGNQSAISVEAAGHRDNIDLSHDAGDTEIRIGDGKGKQNQISAEPQIDAAAMPSSGADAVPDPSYGGDAQVSTAEEIWGVLIIWLKRSAPNIIDSSTIGTWIC